MPVLVDGQTWSARLTSVNRVGSVVILCMGRHPAKAHGPFALRQIYYGPP